MRSAAVRAVWLTGMALLLSSGETGAQYAICNIPCCAVHPTCQTATQVVCSCGAEEQVDLTLEGDNVPPSVTHLSILKFRNINIKSNRIWNFSLLESFSIHEVKTLTIYSDGLSLQNNSRFHSLRIENVSNLHVLEGAISGKWNSAAAIVIKSIKKLSLQSNAVKLSSTYEGPSLFFDDIKMLDMDSGWMGSTLSHLKISNAVIHACKENNFGGKIEHLELYNVSISNGEKGCVNSSGGIKRMSVLSSKLSVVKRMAFKGKIDSVLIQDSQITTVEEKGFELSVSFIQLKKSHFSTLSRNSLSVRADISILLDNVQVSTLEQQALRGLRITTQPKLQQALRGLRITTQPEPLEIRGLKVMNTVNGSLEFGECVRVKMYDLDVFPPWPRVCPTEKWVRSLVGNEDDKPFTQAQFQVFEQLHNKGLCPDHDWQEFPVFNRSQHCIPKVEDHHPSDRTEDSQSSSKTGAASGDHDTAESPSDSDTSAEEDQTSTHRGETKYLGDDSSSDTSAPSGEQDTAQSPANSDTSAEQAHTSTRRGDTKSLGGDGTALQDNPQTATSQRGMQRATQTNLENTADETDRPVSRHEMQKILEVTSETRGIVVGLVITLVLLFVISAVLAFVVIRLRWMRNGSSDASENPREMESLTGNSTTAETNGNGTLMSQFSQRVQA